MLKFRRRESPLLPFYTGSKLPSRRPAKSALSVWRYVLYTIILFILLAGGYTLTNPRSLTKAQPERSGRTLAEQIEQQKLSEKLGDKSQQAIDVQKQGALPGVRSHAGSEDSLQAKQGVAVVQRPPDTLDPENSTLGSKAVDAAQANIVQPIIDTSARAADAVAEAAERVQQSAGQGEVAAKLVQHEVLPNASEGGMHKQALPVELAAPGLRASNNKTPATGLYAASVQGINGQEVELAQYQGKVSLVVNVASQCGYTDSNYKGLNQLYDKYRDQGFEILAFPCNSWNQETGSDSEVSAYARNTYGAKFPLFAKVEAIGQNAHPVMKWLTESLPEFKANGWAPKWNFSKWLVDQNGYPVKSYDSAFNMNVLSADIERLLQQRQNILQSQ